MVEPPLCFRTINPHICTSVVMSCVHLNHDLNQKLSNLGSSLHQTCCHWISLHLCNLAYLGQTLKTFLMRFQWIEDGLNKVSNASFRSCFWSYLEIFPIFMDFQILSICCINYFLFLFTLTASSFVVHLLSFPKFVRTHWPTCKDMPRFQLIAIWAKIYKSLKIQF